MKLYNYMRKYYGVALAALLCIWAFTGYAIAQYPGFSDPGSSVAGATGGLVPVSATIDGGQVPTGSTAQVVVRFRNDGGQPVQTGLIRLYPSSTVSATVSLNQCEEEPLAPGAECAVALSVKGLQAGSWRVEMLMAHSGRTRLVTSTISGAVQTVGDGTDKLSSDVEATPEEIEFGSLNSSQTLVEPITLRNITSNKIDIEEIYIDTSEQAGYSMVTECETLQPGQACMVVITWSPKLKGRSSGVVIVNHNGPAGVTSIPLSGEYQPETVSAVEVFPQAVPGKGLMTASQTEVNFGDTVATASTMTVSLVNTGDADLTIEGISFSGSDNGLSFKSEGCKEGTVLEPIQACPLTVAWSPTRIGSLFDDIQIKHTGARGVLVLPVRGASTVAVSQDQKAIVLSKPQTVVLDGNINENDLAEIIDGDGAKKPKVAPTPNPPTPTQAVSYSQEVANPASVLDGYKITSFSPTRAIVNGPGGSRLIFDQEEVVLGGVPWFVVIQKNGIEFLHEGQRVLLLFDRSLSSINRIGASSGNSAAASGGGT